jgi:hypothetical protein
MKKIESHQGHDSGRLLFARTNRRLAKARPVDIGAKVLTPHRTAACHFYRRAALGRHPSSASSPLAQQRRWHANALCKPGRTALPFALCQIGIEVHDRKY